MDLSVAYIMGSASRRGKDEQIADLRNAVKADSTNIDAWQALIAMQLHLSATKSAHDAKDLLAKDESNQMALVMLLSKPLVRLQKRKSYRIA
ncbi:MAG: hypothetical protein R3C56_35910 [Pirellulaceae bacterium]